jgi:low affinity Fe/Cu permease
MTFDQLFTAAANRAARTAGSPWAFLICCVVVLVWAGSGPVLRLLGYMAAGINTGTTIVTFLMVFLIQNTQNTGTAWLSKPSWMSSSGPAPLKTPS